MRQLFTTTGEIHTPVSWLPGFTRSGRTRPHTTLREDGIMISLGAFTLLALFWDGILHNNTVGRDSFWSGAHIALYLGLTALGVWIAIVLLRHQTNHQVLDFSLIPRGYGLAVVALPLAALAGPADFTWHSVYGFENQVDSAYSPPHQGLFIAGALLAAIPAASGWKRAGKAPSLREFLPVTLSVTAVAAVMLFVIHQLVPFYAGVSVTSAFQNDLVGRPDAYAETGKHVEGLSLALSHYGDAAWPYYFYSTHHTVAGILLFTAVLVGAVLLMRRRWTLPVGTLTIMCTSLGLLFAMLSEYRQAELIPALVLTGIAGDVLLVRLVGNRPETWRMRLFAAILPFVLWSLFFLSVAVLGDGLGWGATLWVGVLCSSAMLGFMMSLLTIAPVPAQDVEATLDVPVTAERAVA